jgi:hypothetical protein
VRGHLDSFRHTPAAPGRTKARAPPHTPSHPAEQARADAADESEGATGSGSDFESSEPPQPLRPCKQDRKLVKRVCALGRQKLPPAAIDRKLSAEGFKNSSGRTWAAKNDGRVVVRILLNHEIPVSGSDPKIQQYAREYAAKLPATPKG